MSIYLIFPVLTAVCWGFAQAIGKKGVNSLPINTFNSIREITAVILAVSLILIMRKGNFGFIAWKNIDVILAASLIAVFGNILNIFLYKAIRAGNINIATVAFNINPFFVFAYSLFFFNEKITFPLTVGMFLIFFSIFLLAFKKGTGTIEHKKTVLMPLLFSLVAAVCQAVIIIGNKMLVGKINIYELNLIEGTVTLAVFLILSGKSIFSIFNDKYIKGTLYAAVSGITGRAFGCLFLLIAINHLDSIIVAPISNTSMFFAIFFGAIFLKEKIKIPYIISSAAAFIGVLLIIMR